MCRPRSVHAIRTIPNFDRGEQCPSITEEQRDTLQELVLSVLAAMMHAKVCQHEKLTPTPAEARKFHHILCARFPRRTGGVHRGASRPRTPRLVGPGR